jgi:DNA gyrase subunit A
MEQMRVIGRNTQGVRMINLAPGEKVVAMDMVAESDSPGELEDIGDSGVDTEEPVSE